MTEAIWAAFDDADGMVRALHALREGGHAAVEAFSPFAVAEASDALAVDAHIGPVRLGARPLPWVALVAGVLGGLAGYFIQWYANAWAYPQNAGGRPANAIPAFVFTTFESIVLVGSCAVFAALLVILGLPRLWDPPETVEDFRRSSDDRFCILVHDREPWLVPEATERLLRELGASDVRRLEASE